MKNLTYDQALGKAAAMCSQSEKAPQDIFEKALSWGLTEPEAARLVKYLTDENFLSEQRFAQAFVSDKFRFEHWGRIKISFTLRSKGIDDTLISEALDQKIDAEEYLQACQELARGRMHGMEQPLSQNDRAKVYRFLAQRGYEAGIISKAMQRLKAGLDAD